MRLVIQRVEKANVNINNNEDRCINSGLVVLVGVGVNDTESTVKPMVEKLVNLRVFDDSNGVMNLSSIDLEKDILVVSNFTLYADCKKGRRPSYINSAKPPLANDIYDSFVQYTKKLCKGNVKTGEFGADMKISLINDGPITIILDSEIIVK